MHSLPDFLPLAHPIVMAPMFLVSNESMLLEAMDAGILAAFPSLNFREAGKLVSVLESLNRKRDQLRHGGQQGEYAVNLIVQRTNLYMEEHLKACVAHRVPVYITSLGNPRRVIESAHVYGARVFCDVTNLAHAAKCSALGCDGFVAVGHGAGGHAGNHPLSLLTESLRRRFPHLPVLAAGGIATGRAALAALASGAAAAYIGTRFVASTESPVPEAYKAAILASGMDDIMMTERLSGTPCAVIRTPYAQKIGTKQSWLERWLGRNPRTRKTFKTLVNMRGMKRLEQAVKPGNYNNLWCAGQSVEMIDNVLPVRQIVTDLAAEMKEALQELNATFSP